MTQDKLADRLRAFADDLEPAAEYYSGEIATVREAATTLEALSSELERVKGERNQALEAEDEAKACFWAIYPEWLELSGKPGITTDAAQTALASIQAKGG
jgi:hypothetical protein